MQTSADDFLIIPYGKTTASNRIARHIISQNSVWKNNGVESHGETLALADLCEYQHVTRKTKASNRKARRIISQNSVWKNNGVESRGETLALAVLC